MNAVSTSIFGRACGTSCAHRILIVDSDPGHRALVSLMLSDYEVALASSGEEALARIEAGGIDLVVSALLMPGMDGLELLRALRDVQPGLPVIAVVPGMSEIDGVYLRGATALGAARTYTQPLTPSVFLDSVRELLDRR